MNNKEILLEIQKLVKEKWYIYVAMFISLKDFYGLAKAMWKEYQSSQYILNNAEMGLLFGFISQNDIIFEYPDSVENFNKMVLETYYLLDNLHNSFMYKSFWDWEEDNKKMWKMLSEWIIYSGDCSYDVQYMTLLKEKYWLDKDYLLKKFWFDIDIIWSNWKNLRLYFEDKVNSWRPKAIWESVYDYLYNTFTISKIDIEALGLESLLLNFVMQDNNKWYTWFWDYNEFLSKPIIEIKELQNNSITERDLDRFIEAIQNIFEHISNMHSKGIEGVSEDDMLYLIKLTTFELKINPSKKLNIELFEGLKKVFYWIGTPEMLVEKNF